MRKWTLRFRAKDRKNFDEIADKKKTVETRAATNKYRKIQKGDSLIFICGSAKLEKKIKKVEIFKSLDAMFRKINPHKIMPSVPTTAEMKKVYYGYPGYKEKLRKDGVIAFYL